MLKQVEPAVESPELLLQALEGELARQRAQRAGQGRHRTAIVAGGLLLVLTLAGVALMILFSMLNDLAQREHGTAPATEEVSRP